MEIALVLALVALAAICIWLASKGTVFPESWNKWIMLLGGGLAVGALALLKGILSGPGRNQTSGSAVPAPVLVAVPAPPAKKDIDRLDDAAKATDAEIAQLRKDAAEAAKEIPDAKETKPASVSDTDLSDFVSSRESELHDQPK